MLVWGKAARHGWMQYKALLHPFIWLYTAGMFTILCITSGISPMFCKLDMHATYVQLGHHNGMVRSNIFAIKLTYHTVAR
jgi:hypothetical protein